MCFLIHPKHSEKKIAKKDIECYKVVCADYTSLLKKEFYIRLGTYLAEDADGRNIKRLDVRDGTIYEGIHSYSTLKMAGSMCWTLGVIIYCIIPKGTEYYYNPEDEEYVSVKIKRIK